jgi:hypothetical protein
MEHGQTINDDPSGCERRYGLPGHGQAPVSISSTKRSVIDDPFSCRSVAPCPTRRFLAYSCGVWEGVPSPQSRRPRCSNSEWITQRTEVSLLDSAMVLPFRSVCRRQDLSSCIQPRGRKPPHHAHCVNRRIFGVLAVACAAPSRDTRSARPAGGARRQECQRRSGALYDQAGCTSPVTCCRWCPRPTRTWSPPYSGRLRPTRRRHLGQRGQLAAAFPQIGPLVDEAKTEVLAFTAFPRNHWPKVRSTNPLERVNKEIKRRARVVGIFPNEPAVVLHLGRHARRMAGQRPPLPIRRLHGPTQTNQQ